MEENKKQEQILNFFFLLFVFAFVFTRIFVYFQYNLKFIDTDQPYMWIGASDFSNGIFKEPRYYGQNYNTFMEALFAVPLLWLDVPVYMAVPAATHFISAFPFCFAAFYLFSQGKKAHALFVLSVVLCMPIQYDVLNSLPRGFVTGLFFSSFFIISLLHPGRFGMFALNTLLAVTGYFVNPNSVVVSGPCLFYLFLRNYRDPKTYFVAAVSLVWVALNYLFFDKLYTDHPEYIQNPFEARYSTQFFFDNISDLDRRFAHITFFKEGKSWSLLTLILLLGFFLFRQNRPAFFAYLVMPSIVLFSFCFGKVVEGSDWVFISYGRMFLGIPLLICLFVPFAEIKLPYASVFMVIPLLFCGYKISTHEDTMAKHFEEKNFMGVRVYPLSSVFRWMDLYKKACTAQHSDFMLVSNKFYLNNILVYGGPACDPAFPQTLETRLEKRHWVRQQFQDSVVARFIFISTRWDLEKGVPNSGWFSIRDVDHYGIYLVERNSLPMRKFIDVVDAYEKMN